MKKILTNKLFMSTFISDKLSSFGDILYYYALMNYVLLLPNPQFALAFITFSETLPMLTSFALGIYADKTRHKLDMILLSLAARTALYVIVGLLMGFTPSLWIVLCVSVINLVSDLFGQYENGLFTPIALRIIAKEDREQAQAFRQSTSSLLSLAFQSLAAIIVGLMSYRHLAFFNASTFAVAGLIMLVLKADILKLLHQNPIQVSEDLVTNRQNILKEMWSSSQMVLREIKTIPVLQQALILGPALNGIYSAFNVILVYQLSQHPEMVIYNASTTIAAFSTCMLLGQVLGSSLVMGPAKSIDIIEILKLSAVFPIFIFSAFVLHNSYLVMVFLFVVCVLTGMINPKISALMMNSLPEDRLATIGAGIETYFMSSMFVIRLLVSGLLLILSADQVTWLFVLGSVMILVYVFKGMLGQKKRQ